MAWSGTLAGLGIAVAALIAAVGKQPISDPGFILSLVVAAVAAVIFVVTGLPDFFAWSASVVRQTQQALQRSDRLITDRWFYTSDGAKAPAAMSAMEIVLPGTGYRKPVGERAPWVRFIVLIGCSEISPAAGGSQLWSKLQRFLQKPPVNSLVNSLRRGDKNPVWTRWSTNSPGVIDAVLTAGDEDEAVASARLELPDGMHRQFRDQRSAMLILHFEPPGPGSKEEGPGQPDGPISWSEYVLRALELPQALVEFLSGVLGLSTSGVPAATLGFRLEARHDMAEIMDITDLHLLRGGRRTSQAIGYFIADSDGLPAVDAADLMITDVLRYALKAER